MISGSPVIHFVVGAHRLPQAEETLGRLLITETVAPFPGYFEVWEVGIYGWEFRHDGVINMATPWSWPCRAVRNHYRGPKGD